MVHIAADPASGNWSCADPLRPSGLLARPHTDPNEPQPLTARDAAKLFEEQARAILPNGRSGQAIWIGTADDPEVLRVDIDIDAGRAALRWLPDGSYAAELEPGQTITVLENPDWGPVTIPAELARVSAATAFTAVAEYATTGSRPACVEWQS